jgi:ferrous iron transport protein B
MEKKYDFTIGLAGNPNVGKTTLFNTLTGSRQHVGNWPGKTVEKKEGLIFHSGKKINLIDLPGAYSLTAYSEEEIITGDFIAKEKPDLLIQIIDAQNLSRNLFLTIQLLELGAPLLIALNMLDLAEKKGIKIDFKKLSILLGVPVIIINSRKQASANELIEKILEEKITKKPTKAKLSYGVEVMEELEKIKKILIHNKDHDKKNLTWISVKLLENDPRIGQHLTKKKYIFEIQAQVRKSIAHLQKIYNQDIDTILASARYGFIKGLEKEVVARKKIKAKKFAEKLDNLLINRFFGMPIFLLLIWVIFQITFKVSTPLTEQMKNFFSFLGNYASSNLANLGASTILISFVQDGIIGGIGGVLSFIPIMSVLFLMITLLEDTGYMARVAYIMDGFMHKIGLHGKAFIPLALGFGCNVPGIMATRTLEKKEDRLLTILINPLMSCGARLPVYALFAGLFFASHRGWVIFSLYLLGIALAFAAGFVFKKLFFKGLSAPFVIELPPYRWPTLQGVLIHIWERIWLFVKKAGTIILAFSLLVWVLASFPVGVEYGSKSSLAGTIGQTIAPIFKPLGFGNWQASVALLFGVVAKEAIVGIFATLYQLPTAANSTTAYLNSALANDFTPLSAYSFMIFVLLYVPCIATLAVIKKETNSWKWPLFVLFYTIILAWLVAFLFYQTGSYLGFS